MLLIDHRGVDDADVYLPTISTSVSASRRRGPARGLAAAARAGEGRGALPGWAAGP